MEPEHLREYRFAIVFYGGVSLAVYENGVARAFCDAVRARGYFGPLCSLLSSRVVVDVVSGASAGGINGLLLAAALESGADFSTTAKLWREAGGLQELLKPLPQSEGSQSLLSEHYYLEQLRRAFREVCTPAEEPASRASTPKEIDVFVTGTDLNGQMATLRDAIGSHIQVKNHALLFHLKHRRGRTRLGVVEDKAADPLSLQADTLATIARITSSFPGAFPPFTLEELSTPKALHPSTAAALRHLGSRTQAGPLATKFTLENHYLVDGGVLENSPFGPVLEAIFHRMPSQEALAVDRTLFYVEPDPKIKYHRGGFTPLQVALNSVLTLPSYDGIAEDVRHLLAHNDAVRRAVASRASILACFDAEAPRHPSRKTNPAYHVALLDSLACLLLGVSPSEIGKVQNLSAVRRVLEDEPSLSDTSMVQALDISYHLRRAFYALYRPKVIDKLDGPPAASASLDHEARVALGRVIKALKLMRDVWLSNVSQRPAGALTEMALSPTDDLDAIRGEVQARLDLLRRYTNGEWFQETPTLAARPGIASDLASLMDHATSNSGEAMQISARSVTHRLLNQDHLQVLHQQARSWLLDETNAVTPQRLASNNDGHALDALTGVLTCVAAEAALEFAHVDEWVFPSELAGGMYELDEIDLVRVSPKDPSLPAGIDASEKVTGDALAHFSAFFRRDWRTNDIAWGHVDTLHQVVRVLLKPESWRRVVAQGKPAFAKVRQELEALGATPRLLGCLDRLALAPDDATALEDFTQQIIMNAQESAMQEYTQTLQQDRRHQDELYGWKSPPLESEAATAVGSFVKWKLGARTIREETPASLQVQYGAQAGLLLTHMLAPTFESSGVAARAGGVTRVLRPTLWLFHALGKFSRSESNLTFTLVFASIVGAFAFAIGSAIAGAVGHSAIGFAVAFSLLLVSYAIDLRRWTTLVLSLVGVGALTLALVVGLPPLRTWASETLITAGKSLAKEKNERGKHRRDRRLGREHRSAH